MDSIGFTRRTLFRGAGVAAGGAVIAPLPAAGTTSGRFGHVQLTEGTNIAHAMSPDGRQVVFDLLTAIWTVPISGGAATRLTYEDTDASQPSWSPDGKMIAFQAYRDGYYHVWAVRPDGSGLTRLTKGPWDHREPTYSPDGRTLAFSSDRGGAGSYGLFTMQVASGAITPVAEVSEEQAMPSWSSDGRRIAYTVDETAIDVVDLESGKISRAVGAKDGVTLFGPCFSPSGDTLAYTRLVGTTTELVVGDQVVTSGEDVFGFAPSWPSPEEILYTADGVIKRRRLVGSAPSVVPFSARVPISGRPQYEQAVRDLDSTESRAALGVASPVASRDGRRIAFRALGALWLLSVGDPRPSRIIADGFFNADPDFSPDGRSIVYSSDRAGEADLWLRDLDSGDERRLTDLPGAQLTPRFAPDGSRVAYTDHDGAVWVLDLVGGDTTQVTPTLFMPGRPSWSPDGTMLALAAVKPYSQRFREGTSQVLTVDLSTGELRYTEPAPQASIATRGDDGPVWSPDGRYLAFVVESCAWIVPVDRRGQFTGPPRQVTDEVTDSLSWMDSGHLLYLNNGRLRSVAVEEGDGADIPLVLSWQPARVSASEVIRAGAMWDGHARTLRHRVDIVVSEGKIAAILPTADRRVTLDARDLTVIPGLMDAHNHWHLRGRQWGARQGRTWLAYGITTTRSPGDPAYQMLEARESLDSGDAVGPRLFGTGEAVDGSRIYYNFMRPTRSREQLALELERARRLGYDMLKTYVRLPVSYQRHVVEQAHHDGLPLSSHYLYPAGAIGMDGMEHTGATNRLGYSHTASRIGRSYADAVSLFAASGMSITPTLFTSAAMYAEDRSLVEDRRSKLLFPSWEYQRLVDKADEAQLPENEATLAELANNVDMILRIYRAGGYVIAGTDAPLDDVAVSLHTNLRAMVRFGFTPYDALTTATRNTARWLGLAGRLGEITPGAFADLSFVGSDPLADIRAAADVRMVLVRGALWTVDELLSPFTNPVAPAAPELSTRVLPAARRDDCWWHTPEWTQRVCCGL